ncbi:MAG: 7TM diverse intracellular signaling domain-containing protein, partial [Steroidobacteraceae bacterium]
MRSSWLAGWLLGLGCLPGAVAAAPTALPAQVLDSSVPDAAVAEVTGGSLDGRFRPFTPRGWHSITGTLWFRIPSLTAAPAGTTPVLLVRSGMDEPVEVFARRGGASVPLTASAVIPKLGGAQDSVFPLPHDLDAAAPFYVRVSREGRDRSAFFLATLAETLAGATAHARMIALVFGALLAMALSALLMRFVLTDLLYLSYGTLFSLQALYLAYFSGEGFRWPVLSWARPLSSYAWNVPIAIAAAAACLFVREFANLRLFSERVYRAFGWLAVAFVVLACSNALRVFGLAQLVADIGNLMFVGTEVFT